MSLLRKVNLDVLANVAILATCAVIGGTAVHRYYSPSAAYSAPPQKIMAGDRAETIPGLSYADSTATLVLHVKSTCPYCTQSMDFYRRVRQAMTQHDRLRFVVVGPEPKDVVQRYLDDHGVRPDVVISVPQDRKPTPTMLVVDKKGIVRGAWQGLQTKDGELRLFQQISGL